MTLLPTPLEEAAKKLDPDAFAVDEFGSYALVSGSSRRASARTHATAAITAYLAQAEKEGLVLVPVEPTEVMVEAGDDLVPIARGTETYKMSGRAYPEDIYRAMIANRPLAAAQNGGGSCK